MAIAFNLPSEREVPEENFSRLNRLLTELYEVLCHILVARQPPPDPPRLDRPFSESDIDRPIAVQPRTRSANIPPPLLLDFDPSDLDDDVFTSPRTDTHDLFSTRHMEIFGSRNGVPRTPAGVLLSPRRERFTFFGGNEKHWRDKGGTALDTDEPDAAIDASIKDSESSDSSIFSSIMNDKLSGSICTAVIFMLGWKLLSTKR